MKNIKVYLTFLVIVVPGIVFGMNGKTVEMGLAIVLGALAGAFLNIDKFAKFKGAGFEAELRVAVEQAYATIENMKEVAKPLIITSLSNMTFANQIGGASLSEKYKYKSELVKLAHSLKIVDGEIKDEIELFDHHHTMDLYELIIKQARFLNQYDQMVGKDEKLSRVLGDMGNRDSRIYPTESQIREVFMIVEIEIDENFEALIQDYLYYLTNKEPKSHS